MGGRKRGSRMWGDGESSASVGTEVAAGEENNLSSPVQGDAASQVPNSITRPGL